MAMSMMDYLNMQLEVLSDGNMTQKKFGEIMHDPELSHEKKLEYLEKVNRLGGYANLSKEEIR